MVNWSNIGLCSTMDGKSVEWLKTWDQAVEKVKAASIRDPGKGIIYPQPSQSQAVGVGMENPEKGINYPRPPFGVIRFAFFYVAQDLKGLTKKLGVELKLE